MIGLIAVAVLAVGFWFGAPYVYELLETVATDDAFVAGHITYVSPRIEDVVTEVLVDQDDRVEPGQLLARFDRQPLGRHAALPLVLLMKKAVAKRDVAPH